MRKTGTISRIKRAAALLLCAVLCLCALSACSGKESSGDDYVYCLNTDRTGLVKVSCDLEGDTVSELAEAAIEKMKEPTDETEYTPAILEGIELLDCSLTGSILSVNFSAQYLEMESVDEKLTRAAIVQSLLQISGVNAVIILVEGEGLKDADGSLVGLLNADDFVDNTGIALDAYQSGTFTLYFANETGDALIRQETTVLYSSSVPVEKVIAEKILQGAAEDGAYPTVNPAANLLSITVKDGICYANFDSTFLESAYDVLPEVTIYSLVNSLAAGTDAESVQITINGETADKYLDTVDISRPLEADLSLVEE